MRHETWGVDERGSSGNRKVGWSHNTKGPIKSALKVQRILSGIVRSKRELGHTCAQDREHNWIPSIKSKVTGTRLNQLRVVVQAVLKRWKIMVTFLNYWQTRVVSSKGNVGEEEILVVRWGTRKKGDMRPDMKQGGRMCKLKVANWSKAKWKSHVLYSTVVLPL